MNTATLFSSAKADWTTPRWLFTRLDAAICLSAGGGWAWVALGCCVMGLGLAIGEEATA